MGEAILVRASVGRPGYAYTWSDGRLDSLIAVTQSSALQVVASNGVCSVIDSTTVSFRDFSATLSMPNVFSPNGDGINDIFRPMEAINIGTYQLDIYDRWGRPVVTLQHPDHAWDGTNSLGHPLTEGVYFWVVRYQAIKDEEVVVVKGNVMLVR